MIKLFNRKPKKEPTIEETFKNLEDIRARLFQENQKMIEEYYKERT